MRAYSLFDLPGKKYGCQHSSLKVPYCQNWNFLAFFMITEV